MEQNASRIIQNFYKIYIKNNRDKSTGYPLDPITNEPIEPKYVIKIICIDDKDKPITTQYFNIKTLDMWFQTRKEPINPLTNISFTPQQISCIHKKYLEIGLKTPFFIMPFPLKTKKSIKDIHTIEFELYIYSKKPEDIDKFRNVLLTSYIKMDLNQTFFSNSIFLNRETILMSCVLNDNPDALQELLMFDINIDYVDDRFNYKAVDLAFLSKKPNSTLILNMLLFNAARTDIPTKRGYSSELTNDIEKLQIYYNIQI